MITRIGRRLLSAPGAAPQLAAAVVFMLVASGSQATVGDARLWISNVAAFLLAAGGAIGCVRSARPATGRARRGWVALALACASWSAGQVAWTVLQTVFDEPTPFPSVADVGYLGFPPAALAAFLWLSPPASGLQVPRRLLDGLTVGCAIGLVAWLSVLASIATDTGSLLTVAVGLAYPVGDVVLLTIAVLTIAQTRGHPGSWPLLGTAALAMAWSDAAFSYLTSRDAYYPGGPADWGWWAAFCLFGLAGAQVRRGTEAPVDDRSEGGGLLGYGTLAAAAVAVIATYAHGERFDETTGALIVVLVVLVLVRQYVALRENRGLARAVQAREAELHRLAFHDGLTGLANRALFLDRLGHALDLAAREARPVSIVFCDLDGFKTVNDSLGHAMGDALLVAVAGRFRGLLRVSDTLARLGGDEFAVLVEAGDGETVARALADALTGPFVLTGRTVAVAASIGVATTDPRRTPEAPAALLHRADVAMYAVKASGRGGVLSHEPDDPLDVTPTVEPTGRHRAPRRYALDEALADAIDRGTVRAFYQPVVDTVTGRIVALEALARWSYEGREVGPNVFVPIAERTGLSGRLTELMLDRACAQLGRWSRELGHQRLRVAVNVSPADLGDAQLPGRVGRVMERYGLAAQQLALEVTETPMWRPDEVLDVLHALRDLGVRIAIDDFGTGHSSLSRLASMPLDTLKLDRIFVADIDHDLARRGFLEGLLDLARHLGLRTIAEGVERPGQLLALRTLRCDLVQGHLTGYPSSAETLTPLILADIPMLPFGLQPGWRVRPDGAVLSSR